ncbi:ParB-like nuclease domain-containing protein [Pleomorphomonas diazotrophica]|nr:ParB N-terminal domain-containing protein [Pleomorphomonas diazotrophica]SFM54383.1 ParB-like nuclease domain-containing protein [Pleomorphomonas diazotrophica]
MLTISQLKGHRTAPSTAGVFPEGADTSFLPSPQLTHMSLQEAIKELERVVEASKGLVSAWPKFAERPDRLPLDAVHTLENAFQPRGENALDKSHVQALRKALKIDGDLDPVLVWQCGAVVYLLDGHHRLRAYRADATEDSKKNGAKATPIHLRTIPVKWFEGSPREAISEGSEDGAKVRLNMTDDQRTDRAWRLVCSGEFSISVTVKATKVSRSTIMRMKAKLKELQKGEDRSLPNTWREAQRAGIDTSGLDWDAEAWKKETVQKMIRGIAREVKLSTLVKQPEIWTEFIEAAVPHLAEEIGRDLNPSSPFGSPERADDEEDEFDDGCHPNF